ncbi:MAG: AraC family transcriptional regulator ligand-binding domain-containing protein [Polyangiales bacterium]
MELSASRPDDVEPSTATWYPSFVLWPFWDEMERRGVAASELARISGVRPSHRGDFFSTVSRHEAHAVFGAAADLLDDPALGLSVGRATDLTAYHLIGHVGLASATLPQAMKLVASLPLRVPLPMPTLERLSQGTMRYGFVGWDASLDRAPGARVEAEMIAVALYGFVLRFLDGRAPLPQVHFGFRAPADLAPYRSAFPSGAPEFEAGGTFLTFPRAALLARRSGIDEALAAPLLRVAEELYGGAANLTDDWTSRVRRLLRSQAAPRLVETRELAQRLGLSMRTLSRRLAREEASLSMLIDEELFARARVLLSNPQTTATEVSSALGYAELSSFFRAFRRWSGGQTPNGYRRHALDDERGDARLLDAATREALHKPPL